MDLAGGGPLPSEAEVTAEVTQGGKRARISLLSVEEQFLAEIDSFPCISHPQPTSSSSHQKLFEFKDFHLGWVWFRDIKGTALGHPELSVEPPRLKIPLGNQLA